MPELYSYTTQSVRIVQAYTVSKMELKMKPADLFVPLSSFVRLTSAPIFNLIVPLESKLAAYTMGQIIQLGGVDDYQFFHKEPGSKYQDIISDTSIWVVNACLTCPLVSVPDWAWAHNLGPQTPRRWAKVNKPVDKTGQATGEVDVKVITFQAPKHDLGEFNALYGERYSQEQ